MVAEGSTDRESAILDARTRALAAPPVAPTTQERLQVVTLVASGERYAVDARIVHGVIAVDRIAPLPHAPAHVAGLVVHAGHVLPTFHLGAVLDLPLAALPEHGQVVLAGDRAVELAIVVDHVGGMLAIDMTTLAEPPSTVGPTVRPLVRGVTPEGVPVLHGQKLLESDRLVVDIPIPYTTRPDEDARSSRGAR